MGKTSQSEQLSDINSYMLWVYTRVISIHVVRINSINYKDSFFVATETIVWSSDGVNKINLCFSLHASIVLDNDEMGVLAQVL